MKTECSFCISFLFTFHLPPDGCTLPIEVFFLFLFFKQENIFFFKKYIKEESRKIIFVSPTTFTSIVPHANDPIQGRTIKNLKNVLFFFIKKKKVIFSVENFHSCRVWERCWSQMWMVVSSHWESQIYGLESTVREMVQCSITAQIIAQGYLQRSIYLHISIANIYINSESHSFT